MSTELDDAIAREVAAVTPAVHETTLRPDTIGMLRRERLRFLGTRLVRSPTFLVGLAITLFWVVVAIAWPVLVPHDPFLTNSDESLLSPRADHLFGTDQLGRDVLSRVFAGATTVLSIAPLATLLGLVGGVAVALVSGYYSGMVDNVIMRVVDAVMSFPAIIIVVLVVSLLGTSRLNLILVIGIFFTPLIARTVRSAVLAERERDYVAAARLRRERGPYIMVREILPNVTGPIVVEGTIRLGYAVFAVGTLSFLGLGLQQPSPDWGLTVALQRSFVQTAPWTILFPALALASLIVGVNLAADGLRKALSE